MSNTMLIRLESLITDLTRSQNEFLKFAKVNKNKNKVVEKKLKRFNFVPKMDHGEHILFNEGLSYSYRNLMSMAKRLNAKSQFSANKNIDAKKSAYKFVSGLNIPCPELLYVNSLRDINPYLMVGKSCVVKPQFSNAGRCIYGLSFHENGKVEDVFAGQVYSDWNMFCQTAEVSYSKYTLKGGWIVESMVVGSNNDPYKARDVKLYTFYGEVALILEIQRWGVKEPIYRTYNSAGEAVSVGKYTCDYEEPMVCNEKIIEQAIKISENIPACHVRVDFLASDTDIRFNELTFGPGNAGNFNEKWDRYLGNQYLKAASLLNDDFIRGKRFDYYRHHLGLYVD